MKFFLWEIKAKIFTSKPWAFREQTTSTNLLRTETQTSCVSASISVEVPNFSTTIGFSDFEMLFAVWSSLLHWASAAFLLRHRFRKRHFNRLKSGEIAEVERGTLRFALPFGVLPAIAVRNLIFFYFWLSLLIISFVAFDKQLEKTKCVSGFPISGK